MSEPEDQEAVVVPIEYAVVVPIEDAFDLHTFSPKEIPEAVEAYLEAAAEAGFREVRLIHGRGTGFQRDRVRQVLARHPAVETFGDAPPAHGGWGATIAVLRPICVDGRVPKGP